MLIFAKAPVPGRAKTRLIPALGAEAAARLAEELFWFTLRQAQLAGVGPIELWVTPGPGDPSWERFLRDRRLLGISLHDQGEGDLGARLARAAEEGLSRAEAILLVGTDCPGLHPGIYREADHRLRGCDAVVGPARDGGYYLLGLRRFHRWIFSNIPWSSSEVGEATRQRFLRLGWSWTELDVLSDLDEPSDLSSIPAGLFAPPLAREGVAPEAGL